MEQQTVTILLYPWLVCHDIKSAMHCSLRLAPMMINHLTSVCIQLSAIAFKCEIAWTAWTITNPIYRIVPSKHPWALAAQVSNLRVGGYTKNAPKWFNYPHARAHPGCEVSCHGTEWTLASSVCLWFVKASPTVEKAVLCYKADQLVASLLSFCSFQSSLAVHEFRATGEEPFRCMDGCVLI